MRHKKKHNPKECDNYLPVGACSDDGGKPTCIAHIYEGRIFDCTLETRGNVYCDFEPKKVRANSKEER